MRAALRIALGISVVLFGVSCHRIEPIDFAVRHGLEPDGTFAVEGYVRGDAAEHEGRLDGWVVLGMHDTSTGDYSNASFRVHSVDRRFRVAGVPCSRAQELTISIQTDDGRGGTIRGAPNGGSYVTLRPIPGDRLVNVQVDLHREWSFRGTVRDALTGAPIEGVMVMPQYEHLGGRDTDMTPPIEFTRTNERGEWLMHGVERRRMRDRDRPGFVFSRDGYEMSVPRTTPPERGVIRVLDVTMTQVEHSS